MRLTDTFFSNHRGVLCSILAALFLSQSGRAAPLKKDHRSLQSRGDIKCPDFSTYAEVQDSMKKNESNFISKKGGHLLKWTPAGLEMHITEANTVSIIESKTSWYPPLKLSFSASHTDFGGVVGSIALLKFYEVIDIVNGSEIDLELVPGQFQTPLWVEGDGAETGNSHRQGLVDTAATKREVSEELLGGTVKDTTWTPLYAYTYPGYDPKKMVKYELDWTKDSIVWKIDGKDRVRYSRIDGINRFPKGPLPLRMGPWTTPQSASWAGILDWQSNPNPVFKVKDIVFRGCKA